jgi:natural product biosynthesis luciferase-like monooxygenase protein
MSELTRRYDALSPGQRELLARRLKERGLDTLSEQSSLKPPTDFSREDDGLKNDVAMTTPRVAGSMQFSLFFFSDDGENDSGEKYRLLLECAKFADEHGFCAVWTPERHFQEFGGLYPNPAVLGAALAMITERIQIRAGSVVLPLHNPIRIAEEWSVVDNLSRGRVGVSFAAGWHPLDFVLSPQSYQARKEVLFEGIRTIQELWAGKSLSCPCVDGTSTEVKVLPRPLQPRLPTWISIAASADSWTRAGAVGANVLTAIVQQPLDELAAKIKLYRAARQEAGHDPEAGQVAVMLHTFVGEDDEFVREQVRPHLARYFRSNVKQLRLMRGIFERELKARPDFDPDNITDADLEAVGVFAFERYFETSLLCGTHEKCAQLIDRLINVGVSEVACFVDFGMGLELVLDSLRRLNLLRMSYAQQSARAGRDAPDAATCQRSFISQKESAMSVELQAPLKKDESIAFTLPDAYRQQPALKILKQAFAQQQYVPLRGLFTGEIFNRLKAEVGRLERFAQARNFKMPGYETPRVMTTLGGQVISRESPVLTELYADEELRRLLGQIAGCTVYDCHDENEWMVATVLHAPGNTHGWHLDDPPLALVVLLDSPAPEQGGLVEFVRDWKDLCHEIGSDPENQVEPTLELCRAAGLINVRHHAMGDAYLLRANQSLHRVTPLGDPQARRTILNLAFELSPNVLRRSVTAELLFED